MQRRFAGILLHFQRQLAKQGLIADDFDFKISFPAANNSTAVRVIRVQQVFDIIRSALRRCDLVGLLRFTVECRLIDLELTLYYNAVCRYLIASLQINQVADNNLTDVNLCQAALPEDFGHFLGFFLFLERRGLALLLALAD